MSDEKTLWETKIVPLKRNQDENEKLMTLVGRDFWEPFQIDVKNNRAYFRRRVGWKPQ